ncbi:hypothetical protein ACFX16_030968 [Malus domestica]
MWYGALRAAIIWTKASRWRKVSKCKSLVTQVQKHLTIQKNRRDAIVRQARVDISLLLRNGQLEQALPRVEKLHKDQCLLAAYDQIAHFCNCITTSIVHVYNNRAVQDLPGAVGEAVASLIFAASRCGELPELRLLRGLFKEQYGWELDVISVELRPGNLVNSQLKEKLCITLIPDEVKQYLIGDIMKNTNVQLALQDSQGTTHQNYSFADRDFKDEQKADGIQIQIPNSETEKSSRIRCSLANGKLSLATLCHFHNGSSTTAGSVGLNKIKKNDIDLRDGNGNPRTHAMTTTPRKSTNGDAVNKDRSKMLVRSRNSFAGPVDGHKMAQGTSPCSSHVHPKLPEYDDLVAKLKCLKAEYRHRKNFSVF